MKYLILLVAFFIFTTTFAQHVSSLPVTWELIAVANTDPNGQVTGQHTITFNIQDAFIPTGKGICK